MRSRNHLKTTKTTFLTWNSSRPVVKKSNVIKSNTKSNTKSNVIKTPKPTAVRSALMQPTPLAIS